MEETPRVFDEFCEPSLYINRELSWLEFNARVLREALDSRNPLLERLKFLAIFSSNLDEFYMVRVAALRRQLADNDVEPSPDGLTTVELLEAIAEREASLRRLQMSCLHRELLPMLSEYGIEILAVDELTDEEGAFTAEYFERQVFPILTPLAVDASHTVPHITNLALSLAAQLRDPVSGKEHFALLQVPKTLPRWIQLGDTHRYLPLERLIGANLDTLFPGFEVLEWAPFRVTRDADMDFEDSDSESDPLSSVEQNIFRRHFGEVSRLEVPSQIPPHVRGMLLEEMCDENLPPCVTLRERYVHEGESLLQLGDLMQLATLDIPELHDPPLEPSTPKEFRAERRSIFDAVREGDILVHHPFDSFATTVEEFIEEAAEDENVLAIKLTLYRTSADTAIVKALADAARRGTLVVVVVELKARFDESNNVNWARRLESAGVRAVFGLEGMKTHSKLALVVRREEDCIRRYVHIGTGNYNSKTARQYTDLGLFTCDPRIGSDVSHLFNHLTGVSHQARYDELLVAPYTLRTKLIELIDREAEHARQGHQARIVAKMNALVDPEIIRALYRASVAGVSIDLIVRGVCCLRPDMLGVSDNIRVMSVVGRFLEHSRIWWFTNGGEDEFYIGSADWMQRNLDRRVEAVTPVKDSALQKRLADLLDTYLSDNRNAWDLAADGTYLQRVPDGDDVRAAQKILLATAAASR